MIGPCYRSVAHDGALLASYEEYIWRAGAKAAGAYSSAHIMLTGHFAPPPASTSHPHVWLNKTTAA